MGATRSRLSTLNSHRFLLRDGRANGDGTHFDRMAVMGRLLAGIFIKLLELAPRGSCNCALDLPPMAKRTFFGVTARPFGVDPWRPSPLPYSRGAWLLAVGSLVLLNSLHKVHMCQDRQSLNRGLNQPFEGFLP